MEQVRQIETFESKELYKKAEKLIKLEQFRDASLLIQEALKMFPNNPIYMSAMGLCIAMQGNTFAGEKMCRNALALDVDRNPMLLVNVGRALLAQGEREEARNYFKQAYRIDNTSAPAALELSRMGVRKKPVLPFLDRAHPLNIKLGKLRHQLKTMRCPELKKL